MKKIAIILFVFFTMSFICGCNASSQEDSHISVLTEKQSITSVDMSQSIEETFQGYLKEEPDLIHMEIGDRITIQFEGNSVPDRITVKDFLINNKGTIKNGGEANKVKSLEVKDKKCIFPLEVDLSAYVSSDSRDYGVGQVIRGFQISYKIDDKKYDIAFVIKTDNKKN